MIIGMNRNSINFNLLKEKQEEYIGKVSGDDANLEDTIRNCISADIPVLSCKSSNNIFSSGKITLEYNSTTLESVTAIINEVSKIKGTKIVFSTTGNTNKPFNVTLIANGPVKDKMFNTISQCIREGRKERKLNPKLIDALNVAITSDYLRTTSKVTVYNNLFKKKYMIESAGLNNSLGEFAGNYNHGKKFALFKDKYAVNASDLQNISLCMKGILPRVKYTEKITKNGFLLDMNRSPLYKVANIDKFNADYADTTGSIRRTR